MDSCFSSMRRQFSHYLTGNIILAIAPLITFTIFTRIFTAEEYGLLNIITVTFSIISSIAICGFPQAAVRFYEISMKSNRKNQYYITILLGTFLISTAVMILFLVSIFALKSNLNELLYKSFLTVTLSLPFTNLTMVFLALSRSEQKAGLYNAISIMNKCSQVVLEILFVATLSYGLLGIFVGDLISSVIISSILVIVFLKNKEIIDRYRKKQIFSAFSMNFFREIVSFGFPLVLVSIMSLLLASGDRYLLQYFNGSEEVGIYSANYNLCSIVQTLIVSPLNTAIVPILLHTWVNSGELKTKEFLTKVFKYYSLIGIPIIFGTIAIGRDLLTVIATNKFTSTENVLPYLMASVIVYGAYFITYAGLQISKNTKIIAQYIFVSVILNLLLNVLLIPLYNITGAAVATLISYITFFLLTTKKSFSFLSFNIKIYPIVEAIFASILMYLYIDELPNDLSIQIIMLKIIIGSILYILLIFIIDKETKEIVCLQLKKIKNKNTYREDTELIGE